MISDKDEGNYVRNVIGLDGLQEGTLSRKQESLSMYVIQPNLHIGIGKRGYFEVYKVSTANMSGSGSYVSCWQKYTTSTKHKT